MSARNADPSARSTPFRKVLVANRGEIAMRIMRTAKAMGLATVAVHSDADACALHVEAADEAVRIGGAVPAESYLNAGRIIEAARKTGADAIHPGYGFLAENSAFAAACLDAGIVFVGPSAGSIRRMGDKAAAKATMEEAGVPCVPGYSGADQDPERLLAEARRIGFPVMIKATAGGGGRGMRLVREEAGFSGELKLAKSEAGSAFGSDAVLVEKALLRPRHIEIQVIADRHGNVVHCGERECSIQRRHQKVIEEAPSPAVDPDLRARMGRVSVEAARAIGYEGAGTFEYLLDGNGDFFFMEMNTRLQVEHPVTEAITGLDLVELQFRIARGEALPLRQDEIRFEGHAIEARLCAEDASADFMPQSGTMEVWRPAAFLRTEHALRDGAAVPPFYDSMIAKLVSHGRTRGDARLKLLAGVEETVALGVRTNREFLARCLEHPVFGAGGTTTAFIAENRGDLLPDTGDDEARAAMLCAALSRSGAGHRLAHRFPMPMRLSRGGTVYLPIMQPMTDGMCRVEMEGRTPRALRIFGRQDGAIDYEEDGRRARAWLHATEAAVTMQAGRQTFDFTDLTFRPAIGTTVSMGDGKVRASMNGRVVALHIAAGDRVEAGQQLVVVEAMKMELGHASPVAGTVTAVHVETGSQVNVDAVMVEVAAAEP